ncbi:MAG TPA: (deoxy)nucleoside triphosphate pyrophosphohydrolase [Spirochaetia bacterium]|nr:(deoxy)nucleoside triphosphate pyrophosphohydrolase [Spirochaetia bacterium]
MDRQGSEKRVRVAAAVIKRDGKILAARRKEGEGFARMWEFPGGKLEPGESLEECLRRELREELDVAADVGELLFISLHDYDSLKVEIHAFSVCRLEGEPKLRAHEEMAWIEPREFGRYPFLEADIPILKHIAERFESLCSV